MSKRVSKKAVAICFLIQCALLGFACGGGDAPSEPTKPPQQHVAAQASNSPECKAVPGRDSCFSVAVILLLLVSLLALAVIYLQMNRLHSRLSELSRFLTSLDERIDRIFRDYQRRE